MAAKRVRRFTGAALAMGLALAFAGQARAYDYTTWRVPNGNWHDAGNWTGGLPTDNAEAQIANGGTATILLNDLLYAHDVFVGIAYYYNARKPLGQYVTRSSTGTYIPLGRASYSRLSPLLGRRGQAA